MFHLPNSARNIMPIERGGIQCCWLCAKTSSPPGLSSKLSAKHADKEITMKWRPSWARRNLDALGACL
eukprot:jgi/Botrbrau1/3949/Bobra.0365s0024.1